MYSLGRKHGGSTGANKMPESAHSYSSDLPQDNATTAHTGFLSKYDGCVDEKKSADGKNNAGEAAISVDLPLANQDVAHVTTLID